jgi:ribosome-binding protein aMBF1 (putative translation factor)
MRRILLCLLIFGDGALTLTPAVGLKVALALSAVIAFTIVYRRERKRRRLHREAMHDGRELVALGRAIRRTREESGLSVEALAAAAGIERADVATIEAGRLDPGYHRLRRLATGFDITSTALLRRVEEHDTAPDEGDG